MHEVKFRTLVSSQARRAGADTDLPVYSVTKHRGFVPSREYFSKQVFSRDLKDYKVVEAGDFAYATIHLDEGSVGLAPERALISPMYTVFQVDQDQVVASYLLRFLKSPRALAHYPQLGRGAVHRRKAISLSALGELDVPLPSLDEQRRIAAILDRADALRSRRRQIRAHLGDLTQAVYDELFSTETYRRVTAGELMPSMRNGLSPATNGKHVATVLTLSAVTRGRFDASAVKSAAFAVEPPAEKRVASQDFLMCRGSGNRALVGTGTFSREDRPDLVFPDTVIAGRVEATKILLPYLEMAWRQPEVRSQIGSVARTTSGIHKINQQTLSAVTIPLPPLHEQQVFVDRHRHIDALTARLERALASDDELFTSLQSRAFRGEF